MSSVLEFFLEFLSRSLHQRHNQLMLSDLGDYSLKMAERADRVIEAESHWQLTREEAANVAAMIAKPPKPNQRMVNAVKLAAHHVVIRS